MMLHEILDATLLAHFQAGDQEAFATLLARYHGLVRAACARQAASGEVDDCVQAVFLVLSRRPQSAVRAGNLPGWLLTTAWYVCRRTHRARARRQRAERVVAQQARNPEIPREPEALAHLDECLRRLPEGQRTVITLHDLVGQSFDEIAGRLGLTRDHVYQLRHRGLETIRALLARRGFTVGATAVVSLLASQAQAASASSPLLVATLCASPTPAASTLATGAMTAMTVATTTPFAIAASLLLATGIGTSVLTAEKTPTPVVPAPVTTPVPQLATVDLLDQEVTFDFQDQDFAAVAAELGRQAKFTPIVAPGIDPEPISFTIDQMKLRYVLEFLRKLTRCEYEVSGSTIQFRPRTPIVTPRTPISENALLPAGLYLADMPVEQRKILEKPMNCDFQEESVEDAFDFVRAVSQLNIILDPAVSARPAQDINLKVHDMRLEDVLTWLAEIAQVRITWHDQGLKVTVGSRPEPRPAIPLALDLSQLPPAVRAKMEEELSIDTYEQTVTESLTFMNKISETNIILDPTLGAPAAERLVTLKLDKQPIRVVLQAIAEQAGAEIVYRNGALFFTRNTYVGPHGSN